MPYKDQAEGHKNNLKYRREHRERVNELNRARYNAKKDLANARKRELYTERRIVVSKYRRQKRLDNPEISKEYGRKYRKVHPEYGRAGARNRRARELLAPGNGISKRQEHQLFSEYNSLCAYCGRKTKLTIDHVVPLSRGGSNDITNAVPACTSCNSSKRDKPLFIWMYSVGIIG